MEKYKHHLHINKLLHNGYNDLVFSNTFRNFGLSLISIFLPVFLLRSGITFRELLAFEVTVLIISLVLHFLINTLLNHVGVKKVLISSYMFSILFYLILHFFGIASTKVGMPVFLMILAFLSALYTSLYWMAYHYYFILSTKGKSKGSKLGILVSVPVMLSVLSPFVGSVIIENVGFGGAFTATILCMACAMVALLFSEEMYIETKNDMEEIINKKKMKQNLVFLIEGLAAIGAIFIWPVLLFYLSISITSMGIFYLVSNIVYAIVTVYSGKRVDKKKFNLFKYGVIGHALTYIIRPFAKSALAIVSAQSIGGFFHPLWVIPLHSLFYKRSEASTSNNVMNREFWMHAGRITYFIFLLILSIFMNPIVVLTVGLIISGGLLFLLNTLFKTILKQVGDYE